MSYGAEERAIKQRGRSNRINRLRQVRFVIFKFPKKLLTAFFSLTSDEEVTPTPKKQSKVTSTVYYLPRDEYYNTFKDIATLKKDNEKLLEEIHSTNLELSSVIG